MPSTMRSLGAVQVITWLGLLCMWMFFGLATSRHIFGATDPKSTAFDRGTEWSSVCFATRCRVVEWYKRLQIRRRKGVFSIRTMVKMVSMCHNTMESKYACPIAENMGVEPVASCYRNKST
jgi:hypothetical protein